MLKLFIDTNILIDYSKGFSDDLSALIRLKKNNKALLYINPIVIGEYWSDRKLQSSSVLKRKALNFINFFENINITREIGFLAGELIATKQVEFLGDAYIASTCLVNSLQLFTRNQKDFRKVKTLKLYSCTSFN